MIPILYYTCTETNYLKTINRLVGWYNSGETCFEVMLHEMHTKGGEYVIDTWLVWRNSNHPDHSYLLN